MTAFGTRFAAVLAVCGTALLTASPADAMPAFAREYRLNCSTCHKLTPQRLNALGRNFMERGYQMPEGAERPATGVKFSRQDEKLTILEQLPLALRIKNSALWRSQARQDENWVDVNAPLELQLLAGGSLFKNTSFFVNFPFFTGESVGVPILAFVQFNNLLGKSGSANLRIGKFNILGMQFPNHRSLTVNTAKAPAVQVGLNPVVLDGHQTGVSLFGRPGNGRISYEFSAVNGAGPAGADEAAEGGHAHGGVFSTDGNDFKDLYGRLTYGTASRMHTVGVLGYFGKTALGVGEDAHGDEDGGDDDHDAAANEANDSFRILGLDGEFNRGSWNLRSAAYLGHHDDPFGQGTSIDYQSVFGELSYAFDRRLLGMLHYDQVISSDLESLEHRSFMPHLSYLLLDNLRLSVEYMFDLDDSDNNRALALIDVTM